MIYFTLTTAALTAFGLGAAALWIRRRDRRLARETWAPYFNRMHRRLHHDDQ